MGVNFRENSHSASEIIFAVFNIRDCELTRSRTGQLSTVALRMLINIFKNFVVGKFRD